MKQILSILALLFISFSNLTAQIWTNDTVSMNPGLSRNVFYKMATNGSVRQEPSTNWHIGFSLSIGDSASIFANHGMGNAVTRVFNIHKAKADWNSVSLGDTLGANKMYNGETSWSQGAFNDIPSANPFNYGWGTYNLANNTIYGDSIFIVATATGFYKFMVDSLVSQTFTWHFRVQKFDLIGMTQAFTITRAPAYSNRLFAYFNLDSMVDLDREPVNSEWDVQFITYPTLVVTGPPPTPPSIYPVTGVLANKGILTTKVSPVEVDNAFNNYLVNHHASLDKKINGVGYDWKTFNNTNVTYDIADSTSYFIKDKSNDIYQLEFLYFAGNSIGTIAFRKRLVTNAFAVNVENTEKSSTQLILYPNPTQQKSTLLFTNTKEQTAQVTVLNLEGKVVKQFSKTALAGLNAWELSTDNLSAGQYLVHMSLGKELIKQKMTIIR